MFLKHGAKNLNEIQMVAPTGFYGFCIVELCGMIRAGVNPRPPLSQLDRSCYAAARV